MRSSIRTGRSPRFAASDPCGIPADDAVSVDVESSVVVEDNPSLRLPTRPPLVWESCRHERATASLARASVPASLRRPDDGALRRHGSSGELVHAVPRGRGARPLAHFVDGDDRRNRRYRHGSVHQASAAVQYGPPDAVIEHYGDTAAQQDLQARGSGHDDADVNQVRAPGLTRELRKCA